MTVLSTRLNVWGASSVHSNERVAWTAGNYKLKFFTPDENNLLDLLMEIIIPADEHSGGAHAAKVSLFADWIIFTGTDIANADLFANQTIASDLQKSEWRRGLQLMKEEATKSSLTEVVSRLSAGEANPQSQLERFFVTLKQMTLVGYYTSEIGIHQDLEYQGNKWVPTFPECTDH